MATNQYLRLPFRRQRLRESAAGYITWETFVEDRSVLADQSALLLCDVWDLHWCRGANERLTVLLPRMNELASVLRAAGVLIVHAPSETMDAYAETPARVRASSAPPATLPPPRSVADLPLPINDDDEGCDTPPDMPHQAWTRQHPAIVIDHERDAISDDGQELYRLYRHLGITTVLIMGVHANMCVLNRSFAIKALVQQGFDVALVRDLTDTMYNPAQPPYVDHDGGTRLVVSYIEQFWCATVSSADLLAAAQRDGVPQ